MRIRTWIFAFVVAVMFTVNLGLLSLRVAQTGEDTVHARLAQSASGLRAQLELIDARLSPRSAAEVPELADVTRSPADPAQPMVRPDDRALRAAASALAPEPDLLAVVNAQGALISRRARPAQALDDISLLPLAKAALERTPPPAFAVYDGATYRIASARVPGNGAAVIAGTAADDRLASQLKSQIDADVTLIANGKVIASSLSGDARARVLRWAAAPGPGYGVLPVYLPGIGSALSGKLPRGATRYAVRGALVPLDGGMQAALTVPASPYLGWLARYQAFYLLGLLLFVIFGFFWGLFVPEPKTIVRREVAQAPAPRITPSRPLPRAVNPTLLGTDIGEARAGPDQPAGDVPWGDTGGHAPVETPPVAAPIALPAPAPSLYVPDSLDPVMPPADVESEPSVVVAKIEPAPHPLWSADPFTPTPEHVSTQEGEPQEPAKDEPADDPFAGVDAARAEAAAKRAGAQGAEVVAEPPKSNFNFANLLDDAPSAAPDRGADFSEKTNPGAPNEELMARARAEAGKREAEGSAGGSGAASATGVGDFPDFPEFPGDEPTRVEPVSAALLDKLRARDEDQAPENEQAIKQGEAEWAAAIASAQPGTDEAPPPEMPPEEPEVAAEPEPLPEPEPEPLPEPEPKPLPEPEPEPAADPDEVHWQETFAAFVALKEHLGEPGNRMSYDKFAAKLAKNRADLMAKHHCRSVRFSVYEKDGKASIKASAIR
jgi:hypothetical protein